MNRFSWETQSDDWKKTFCGRELAKIAQNWKGYLASVTRCINRAVDKAKQLACRFDLKNSASWK